MSRLVVTTEPYHRYSLDGRTVPSVTGVINKALGKPGLLKWAAKSAAIWCASHVEELQTSGEDEWIARAAGASDRIRDASANAGKQVHSIAERLVYGDPVETADPRTGEMYDDDVLRMGAQVARFMDRWDVSPDTALVERPVFNEEALYAGTFDLSAVLRGGDRWLIDYKSGATGVYPEHSIQLTGYARATHVVIDRPDGDAVDLLFPPVDRCAVLWVRPDTWELIPVASDEDQWRTFRAMLFVAEWTKTRPSDLVGAALPVPEAS
jgi:hypothetical protein